MDQSQLSLQTRVLYKSDDSEDFQLYKAGLEWDLLDPIVIENREDMKSESKWKDLVEPYHHQVTNLITFCRRLPVTLLSDDVGLGKTISAGLIASELIARNRVSKILIVCPKLLMPQWAEELKFKFDLPSMEIIGKNLATLKLPDEPIAVITTYHSARLHLDAIAKVGFDMLILDEAHKLRNLYGVNTPPQVAVAFHKVLANRVFKYVLMLTATPIQNRLWDLYSLVDLLTVARGHENPLGNPGMFARKFIADNRTQARQLKPEAKDEFRSIIYGYMSRVRRGDADLVFPERVVEIHTVDPSEGELALINAIAEPIQKLNFLAQITILQALISSPEALVSVLNNMARKGTAPKELAEDVKAIAKKIRMTSKLKGLEALVKRLRSEQPEHWRMIVFTRWRETQTTIQAFLEERGITCGLINGDSGQRNQETIHKLKEIPPEIHVIVSTEAGSEGVNLQAANVLVNYDLPWNPMIVEQRIGRIQRLASEHANVCIFNIVLKGTFEEYIVARLMEKLQMASHAIGDIEALLEASGLGGDDDTDGFEKKIAKLVLASLKGKDVDEEAKKAAESIEQAKLVLEKEEKNINDLLGAMDEDIGPKCPKLPINIKSMESQDFVIAALTNQGTTIKPQSKGLYLCEFKDDPDELIAFEKAFIDPTIKCTLYEPGTPEFERVVNKITSTGKHFVEFIDKNPEKESAEIAKEWVSDFGGIYKSSKPQESWNCFEGKALVKVRAAVAHDSYERLIEIQCLSEEHIRKLPKKSNEEDENIIKEASLVGIVAEILVENAVHDPGISEFCRFYNERKVQEVRSAGSDERRKKKLSDEFTPRLEMALVGLQGTVHKRLKLQNSYKIQDSPEYSTILTIEPKTGKILDLPEMGKCENTGQLVPQSCIEKCAISGLKVLKHLLVQSTMSDRKALSEHTMICSLSGIQVLEDEIEKSVISGKAGARNEFVFCAETGKPLLPSEAEKCEVTGKYVMPGILEKCEITGKMVLSSELEKSALSGKKALKKYFVSSSISNALLLEEEAIKSNAGKFCSPAEAKMCMWSQVQSHPDDLVTCNLTGIPIQIKYSASTKPEYLEPLANLLNQISHKTEAKDQWLTIETQVAKLPHGKNCKVLTAEFSPDKKRVAVCIQMRSWLGLKVRHCGLVYSTDDQALLGRIAIGKQNERGWTPEKS